MGKIEENYGKLPTDLLQMRPVIKSHGVVDFVLYLLLPLLVPLLASALRLVFAGVQVVRLSSPSRVCEESIFTS